MKTVVTFDGPGNKLILINPLTKFPYKILVDKMNTFPQIQSLVARVVTDCKKADSINGAKDDRYYSSLELSPQDWELILLFFVASKDQNKG